MMDKQSGDLLAPLGAYDTPTICNALEVVDPSRQGFGYTVRPLFCARPHLPPMVGRARTARIRSSKPSGKTSAELAAQRFEYFGYIAAGARPSIVVIQDMDDQPGYGAFWGEVMSNIHFGFGALGTVTNGSIRDLPDCAEGFQLLAGSVGPSHAYAHLIDWGGEVEVHGMTVRDGDIIHADQHGAVVVPDGAALAVPGACEKIFRQEKFLIDAAKQPGFTMDDLAAARAASAAIE